MTPKSDPVISAPPLAARPAASASANPVQNFVDHLPLQIRRTFFNNAPTVQPVQVTGQHDGVISGTIGAVDPEGGDVIKYKVVASGAGAPLHGTVSVASDGTFTYTPGADFTGTDQFAVRATDVGTHINLLNLFRASSTTASVTVSQYAIGTPTLKFAFTFDSASESWWSPASRAALQAAGDYLSSRIVPSASLPVTVSYLITVQSTPGSSLLGTGSSSLAIVGSGKFEDTVVQHKILTGIDQNGTQPMAASCSTPRTRGPSTAPPRASSKPISKQSPCTNSCTRWASCRRSEAHRRRPTERQWTPTPSTAPVPICSAAMVPGSAGPAAGGSTLAAPPRWRQRRIGGTRRHWRASERFDVRGGVVDEPSIGTGVRRIKLSAVEIGMLEDLGYTVTA